MTDNFQQLDLEGLKATLEEKKLLLEQDACSAEARTLYKELKALQYEISMRSVRLQMPSEGAARRAAY
ncbi:MAG: hypothetical protein EOO11_00125 [Chitinophagaceae bacterium]|nr:MAG: hypothetical protein EOO11_00125 [Chitinophagaceae bacterium]